MEAELTDRLYKERVSQEVKGEDRALTPEYLLQDAENEAQQSYKSKWGNWSQWRNWPHN